MAKSIKKVAGETSQPLVYVIWEDHSQKQGWTDVEDAEKSRALSVHSVGIKIYENKKLLVMSDSVSENMSAISPMTILKNCITFRKDFRLRGFQLGS